MKTSFKSEVRPIFCKLFFAPAVGNILEFYDFALYGFLLARLLPVFFPSDDPFTSLVMGFGVFSVSFIARPLGALVFGHIGDTRGRKDSLSLSLIMMSISTVAIGLLPSYESIGIAAPLLLTFFRFLQGLCLGGEYNGSLIFVIEHAENMRQKPSLIASIVSSAGVSGWFLGVFVCYICTKEGMPAYAWRFPFLTGALVGGIGYYIRRAMPESPALLIASKLSHLNQKIYASNWRDIASISGIGILMGALFYGLLIFPNSYLPITFNISSSAALQITSIGIGTYMFFLPLAGWLGEYIGGTRCLVIFSSLTFLCSYPLYSLLMSGDLSRILAAEIGAALLLAGFMGPAGYIMSIALPVNLRQRLTSLSYNIGACLFGGTAPSMSLYLIGLFQDFKAPALYLGMCSLIGVFSSYYLYMKIKTPDFNKVERESLI